MIKKTRVIGIAAAVLLGLAALLYLGGILGQLLENYQTWQRAGGMAGQVQIELPSVQITDCVRAAFTFSGLKAMGILLLIAGAFAAYSSSATGSAAAGKIPGALPSARRAPTAPPPGWGKKN